MPDKVIFFGTPKLAVSMLDTLVDAGFEIAAVVTQPDKTKGRNRSTPAPPPVKKRAEALGLPVMQPDSVKDAGFLDELESIGASVFALLAYGQILPERLIDMPKHGMLNAHASLLPKLRGPAPINWAIINGFEKTGMTIQKVRFKLDSGPVCWAKEVPITENDNALTLAEKLIPLGNEGMVETIRMAFADSLHPVEQDESEVTYAPMIKKEDGFIDWGKSATEIDRMIRGFTPWPGALTNHRGDLIKIHEARPLPNEQAEGEPGDIVEITKDYFHVICGEGVLEITELQCEGKKRLCANAFLCGRRMNKSGERFTMMS